MQQVLLNLMTNANKFQNNKKIRIYCEYKKSPLSLDFRVEDEGIGILEKDVIQLFSPFSKIEHGR